MMGVQFRLCASVCRWGLSKLGIGDCELFTAVAGGALQVLHEFAAQNLVRVVSPKGPM